MWRLALVIIMCLFLLTLLACGRKGDPIPPQPEQPKAGTSTQQPDKPTGVTPGK